MFEHRGYKTKSKNITPNENNLLIIMLFYEFLSSVEVRLFFGLCSKSQRGLVLSFWTPLTSSV